MENYYAVVPISSSDIEHHGVNGMKWGKRNGPPYPLDSQGKAKLERQIKKENAKANKNYASSSRQTGALVGGVIVGGIGVAATITQPYLTVPVATIAGSVTAINAGIKIANEIAAKHHSNKAVKLEQILKENEKYEKKL